MPGCIATLYQPLHYPCNVTGAHVFLRFYRACLNPAKAA
jgi:hypothetical protein